MNLFKLFFTIVTILIIQGIIWVTFLPPLHCHWDSYTCHFKANY